MKKEISKKIKHVRPSWDEYFINMANYVSTRATCDRGYSGCVIVKDKRVISTGYVGAPPGMPHCDEYALPYAPDTNWKPETVFKLAVRSLVLNLRGLASAAIWLTVYAALWLPLLLIAIFAWKKFFKKI
jgi:hypothetical protein